jgi:hypothetical protein
MNLFTTPIKELRKTIKRIKVTYNDGYVKKFELLMWEINRNSIKVNLVDKGLVTVKPVYKLSKYVSILKSK